MRSGKIPIQKSNRNKREALRIFVAGTLWLSVKVNLSRIFIDLALVSLVPSLTTRLLCSPSSCETSTGTIRVMMFCRYVFHSTPQRSSTGNSENLDVFLQRKTLGTLGVVRYWRNIIFYMLLIGDTTRNLNSYGPTRGGGGGGGGGEFFKTITGSQISHFEARKLCYARVSRLRLGCETQKTKKRQAACTLERTAMTMSRSLCRR
jgi:hypothetical protein